MTPSLSIPEQPAIGALMPVKKLDRKNTLWTSNKETWDQIRILYHAGAELRNNLELILRKREKELYDVYYSRANNFVYQPIISSCIRWYISKLFQREPMVEGKTTDKRFASFLQDCDNNGTTFVEFGRQMIEKELLYGYCWTLVDLPKPDEDLEILNRADESAAGLDKPYLVLYDPIDVINWSVDNYGNMKWAVIKTVNFIQEDPLDSVHISVNWYVFDRKTYKHYQYKKQEVSDGDISVLFSRMGELAGQEANAQAVLVKQGPHALSKFNSVPVRCCSLPESMHFSEASLLHLIDHARQHNAYSWKLYCANFPQLVIKSDAEAKGITRSETSFLQLLPGDTAEYLEPGSATFKESRDYMAQTKEEIYRSWHLQAQAKTSSSTSDGASGWSKELEMAPSIDILNAVGDSLRAQQQLVLIDVKNAAGMAIKNEADKPDVNGYRFESKPALQDITVAQELETIGVLDDSDTLDKVVKRNIALSVADGENEETKEKIKQEVMSAPTRAQKAAALQAQQDASSEQEFTQSFNKRLDRATESNLVKEGESSVSDTA